MNRSQCTWKVIWKEGRTQIEYLPTPGNLETIQQEVLSHMRDAVSKGMVIPLETKGNN